VIGGAAGAAGEAADDHDDRGFERRTEGTGPTDPLVAGDGGPLTAEDEDQAKDDGGG
jgi:hypothetical protein